jgi:glycosyltransferase involved in cell wall biosynthesis
MNYPRISIIIPTLNQGQYIESAILSILRQDYQNLQLIIVDGASTDTTNNIISKYKSRIDHFISEKDSGQTEAINKGLALADGDIITWLNSDDYYEPGIFKEIYPHFKEKEIGIVHGRARIFGENKKTKVIGPTMDLPAHLYLPYMRMPQPAMFLSRAAVRAAGQLNQSLHFAMDFELTAKVVLAGFKIKRIDTLIANYRFHQTSKSNLNHKFLEEWTREVHNIFCSIPGAQFPVIEMELLFNLPPKPDNRYNCMISVTKKEAEEVFLEHLNFHFHEAYRATNEIEMRRIAGYLKRKFPRYYDEKNYSRYLNRVKMIPRFILNLLRRFSR